MGLEQGTGFRDGTYKIGASLAGAAAANLINIAIGCYY